VIGLLALIILDYLEFFFESLIRLGLGLELRVNLGFKGFNVLDNLLNDVCLQLLGDDVADHG
jgi:hypothetical protein